MQFLVDIVHQHEVQNMKFIDVLTQPLGFKIPVSQERVDEFPEVFSHEYCEVTEEVEYWMKHRLVGDTETSVTSLNRGWLGIVQCLCGVTIYQNASHSSSKHLL